MKQSPEWPWLTMLSAVDGRTKKMDEEMFRELEGIAITSIVPKTAGVASFFVEDILKSEKT